MPDIAPIPITQDASRRFFATQKTNRQSLTVQKNAWYIPFLLPLYLLVGTGYFYWRVTITMDWGFWLAWPLLIADLYTLLVTILYILVSQKIVYPRYQPPLPNASVDILIPTYNEPVDMVEMTATGALAVRGVNEVFVLNDGNRPEIKAMAERIGARHVGRDDNTHAKAGNMNNGLKHSTAEFVIFQDCDFVPQPQMIERLSGYFRDPQLAFVQTPQVFYNVKNSIQHRASRYHVHWSEQTMFYDGIQPTKNYHNAAIFCGTNAMLRRKALDSIGGMATGTATEDIHTALILQAQGWKSWYINEKLAFGVAPEDIKEYYRQRVRWGAGSLGLLLRTKDSPLRAKGMTLMQRLCYISSTTFFTSGIAKLLYFVTPVVAIFANRSPVAIDFMDYWIVFLPFFVFSLLIAHVFSRGSYHPLFTEQFNILNIFSNMASLKGVFKVQKKFGVSIKKKARKEGEMIYRSMAAIMAVMLAADWYAFFYWFYLKGGTISGFVGSDLFVGVFWNSINLVFVMTFLYFLKVFNEQGASEHHFELTGTSFVFDNTTYTVSDINLSGARLTTDPQAPYHTEIALPFTFEGEQIPITATVVATTTKPNPGRELQVRFTDLTLKQRRVLIYYFFHRLVPEMFALKKSQP